MRAEESVGVEPECGLVRRPRLAAALLKYLEGGQWISATGVLVMAFGADSCNSFLCRLHLIANTSQGSPEEGQEAAAAQPLESVALAAVSSDDKKTEGKLGYPPLVELLRESMQHASLSDQLEVSMEHIVTKLNWASTQLSRAVEQLREVSARASRQSAQPQLAQGSSVPEADRRGRGGGTHALLEALEDQSGAANKRRQCRAMVDVTQKLLLLIDALCCHLHRELLSSSCSVVLQRLVDSLLHLLSLTAGPNARLFDTRDDTTVRRMGVTWHLRPHNLLLPLAAALISLVLPEERQMPRPSCGRHCAAEAQREGGQEVANVLKALVCSPSFDIQRFRELANVRSWVDTSLLSLAPAPGGQRQSSESCAATSASAGPNTCTACVQDAMMRLERLLHALLAGLQTWNAATYVHLCLSLSPSATI
jgi:hypothetical protein